MVRLDEFVNNGSLSIPAAHFTPGVQDSILKAQMNGGDLMGAAFDSLQKEFPSVYNKQESQPQSTNETAPVPNTVSIPAAEYQLLQNRSKLLDNPVIQERLMNGSMTQTPDVNQAGQQGNVSPQQIPNDAGNNMDSVFDQIFNTNQSMKQTTQSNQNPATQQTQQNDNVSFEVELQRAALSQGLDPNEVVQFATQLDASTIVALCREYKSLSQNTQKQPSQATSVQQPYTNTTQPVTPPTTIVDKPYPSTVNANPNQYGFGGAKHPIFG